MESQPARPMDIDEDPAFQEKFWTFQRFAWWVMFLLIIAALAGLTGSGGWLSHGTAAGTAGSVDYPRISRWQAAEQMAVTVPESATSPFTIDLDAAFADLFSIEDIEPQPSRSLATARGHRFEFELGEREGTRRIIFHLRGSRPSWPTRVDVVLGGDQVMSLPITVLP